jgi:hypothetical protein
VFGGKGEELSYVEFTAGSAELPPAGVEKLETLAKGLFERPGLSVEIEGSADPAADRESLVRQKLEQELRAYKWSTLRPSEQDQVKPEQVAITQAEFDGFISRTHARRVPAATSPTNSPAKSVQSPTGAPTRPAKSSEPTKGAGKLNPIAEVSPALPRQEIERQLFQLIEIPPDDYRQLARRRAERVKEHLIQVGKVEEARVMLSETPEGGAETNGTRVLLQLR